MYSYVYTATWKCNFAIVFLAFCMNSQLTIVKCLTTKIALSIYPVCTCSPPQCRVLGTSILICTSRYHQTWPIICCYRNRVFYYARIYRMSILGWDFYSRTQLPMCTTSSSSFPQSTPSKMSYWAASRLT